MASWASYHPLVQDTRGGGNKKTINNRKLNEIKDKLMK